MMRWREFITALGGAAAWPVVASAQQPAKLPTIGYLGASTPSFDSHRVGAFVQRLRERGWIEGRSSSIDGRRAAPSATPRSRPSSCGSRSMSLSQRVAVSRQ